MTVANRDHVFCDLEEMFDSLGRPRLRTRRESGHEATLTSALRQWLIFVSTSLDLSSRRNLPEIKIRT